MRISRWGRSSYESDALLAAEAAALSTIPGVTVLQMRRDAEVITVNSGTYSSASIGVNRSPRRARRAAPRSRRIARILSLYSSGNVVLEHQVVSVYETNLHA